ncbi:hypothetical protein ABT095_14925 [Kitasatospora sp. NPDC002227]|uniref:hypothetical protein n=1 Tax=Kitasatospora sp. NPDC002227 TaxID=3154773 RepID=UPI003327AAF3
MTVLVISPSMTVSEEVPLDPDGYLAKIRSLLGGPVNEGNYHRRVRMWTRDSGAAERNVMATALASAWLGRDLAAHYWLYGPVVLSGVDTDGRPQPCPPEAYRDVTALQEVFHELRTRWATTAPADDNDAWQQVLARALAAVPAVARTA